MPSPWYTWQPPDDIEIDGARHLAPQPPPVPAGPDTDLQIVVNGFQPGVDPAVLIEPYRLAGDNASIPAKGMVGVGPQPGTATVEYQNRGTQILPGIQRYLEMGGQRQVGILPRTVPVEQNQLWDAAYVLNPSIEVV